MLKDLSELRHTVLKLVIQFGRKIKKELEVLSADQRKHKQQLIATSLRSTFHARKSNEADFLLNELASLLTPTVTISQQISDMRKKQKQLEHCLLSEKMDQENQRRFSDFLKGNVTELTLYNMRIVHTETKQFGEQSLTHGQPRSARIVADCDCHLAVIPKSVYEKVLVKFSRKKLQMDTDLLLSTPFFSNMSRSQVKSLLPALKQIKVFKDQLVVQQGQISKEVYFIISGEFALMQTYKTMTQLPHEQKLQKTKRFLLLAGGREQKSFVSEKINDLTTNYHFCSQRTVQKSL